MGVADRVDVEEDGTRDAGRLMLSAGVGTVQMPGRVDYPQVRIIPQAVEFRR